jgi:hypothetical protein
LLGDVAGLTWDGILTVLVGIAAIIGATVVGVRQTGIAAAVAKAQEQQHRDNIQIQRQALQLSLLEKRQGCISQFRTILVALVRNGLSVG